MSLITESTLRAKSSNRTRRLKRRLRFRNWICKSSQGRPRPLPRTRRRGNNISHLITLARADVRKDMAAFLSYAVGCMMGRYSLDALG